MEQRADRPTLGEGLPLIHITLRDIIQKSFSGYYILDVPLIFRSAIIFEIGAVLGRARHANLELLMRLYCPPGHERALAEKFRAQMIKTITDYGKEPDSLSKFWYETRFSEISWLFLADITDEKSLKEHMARAKKLVKRKMRLYEAFPLINDALIAGMTFGATYPELTERLWRQSFETYEDAKFWQMARKAGLELTEQQQLMPLEEMEKNVLEQVAAYVNEYIPELAEPLNLHVTYSVQ